MVGVPFGTEEYVGEHVVRAVNFGSEQCSGNFAGYRHGGSRFCGCASSNHVLLIVCGTPVFPRIFLISAYYTAHQGSGWASDTVSRWKSPKAQVPGFGNTRKG